MILPVIGTSRIVRRTRPEIIEMSAPPSAACDIWSLGCTILELTTGKPPHFDLSPMAALFRIVQDGMPRVPACASEALRDFLFQCFNREASLRADARSLVSHAWLQRAAAQSPSVSSWPHETQTSAQTSQPTTCKVSNHTDSQFHLCNVMALKQYREVENDDIERGLAMCNEANLHLKDTCRPSSSCPSFAKEVLAADVGEPHSDMSEANMSEANWDSDQRNCDSENDSIVRGLGTWEYFDESKSSCNIDQCLVHDNFRDREISGKEEEVDVLLLHLTMTRSAKAHDISTASQLTELVKSSDGEERYLSEVGAVSLVESLRCPAGAREALQAIQILLIASSNAADVLVSMGIAPLLVSVVTTNHTNIVKLLGIILNLFRLRCSGNFLRLFLFGGGIQLAVELLLKPNDSVSLCQYAAALTSVEFLLHVLCAKFKLPSLARSRAAVCRALALRDAPARLVASLEATLALADSTDRSAAIKIACTLTALCDSDAVVKESVAAMRSADALLRVVSAFPTRLESAWIHGADGETEARLAVKLLGALKAVSMAGAAALDSLATCGGIEIVVTILAAVQESMSKGRAGVPLRDELEDQLVPTIYYLCRIDRLRLARAARCGATVLLVACVARRRHLKQFALAILCDLCHAAANDAQGGIGAELWRAGGVTLYVHLLVEVYWGVRALAALNAWIKADNRVESAMVGEGCAASVVCLFCRLDRTEFQQSLAPLLDACETSPLFARAVLDVCDGPRKHAFMLELAHKLERHAAAFARKTLLEILRAVLAASETPKRLVLAANLDTVLVWLLTDGNTSEQVLVFDLARTILTQAC